MSADAAMPLGSTTKTFTAVAVLQLVESGAIDLDAPVTTYLPWFRVADEQASRTITVRHLLNHTSGLSDVTYNRVLDGHTSLADGVRDLRHARPAAPVGSTFLYFSGNHSTLPYWVAAHHAGETNPWFNVLIHVLGSAGVLILLLVPSLERWVDFHVMSP